MLMYQKSFNAASRLMTALDEALDRLINQTAWWAINGRAAAPPIAKNRRTPHENYHRRHDAQLQHKPKPHHAADERRLYAGLYRKEVPARQRGCGQRHQTKQLYREYQQNEIYLSNIGTAYSRIDTAESILVNLSGQIGNYDTILKGMNGIYNADDMQTMATEMRVLQQQMVSDLNQKYTSQYLFSGSGGSAPFSLDADGKLLFRGLDVNDPANGAQFKAWCAEEIPTDIGAPFDTSLCALNYVGYGQDADGLSNNAISLLGQMADAIEAGTFEGDAGRYLDKIQSSHQRLVVGLTELDARANHLTVAQDRLEPPNTQPVRAHWRRQ